MLLACEMAFRTSRGMAFCAMAFCAILFSPPNVSGYGSSFSSRIKLQSRHAFRWRERRGGWPGRVPTVGPQDNGDPGDNDGRQDNHDPQDNHGPQDNGDPGDNDGRQDNHDPQDNHGPQDNGGSSGSH